MRQRFWTAPTSMAAGMIAGAAVGAFLGTEATIALVAIGAAAGYAVGRRRGP